jgi:hypothetical protein
MEAQIQRLKNIRDALLETLNLIDWTITTMTTSYPDWDDIDTAEIVNTLTNKLQESIDKLGEV